MFPFTAVKVVPVFESEEDFTQDDEMSVIIKTKFKEKIPQTQSKNRWQTERHTVSSMKSSANGYHVISVGHRHRLFAADSLEPFPHLLPA